MHVNKLINTIEKKGRRSLLFRFYCLTDISVITLFSVWRFVFSVGPETEVGKDQTV